MATVNDLLETALISAFESVLAPKTAVYVAVPVTSGPRLWKLAKELGLSDLQKVAESVPERYKNEVLSPNSAYAAEFAASVRGRHGLVIDPSRLVIRDWSQKQYWVFWEEIIVRYVRNLLVSRDWAYSRGCVYECMFAVQQSIPVLSEKDCILPVAELRRTISEAIQIRESLSIQAEFLDEFMDGTRTALFRQ